MSLEVAHKVISLFREFRPVKSAGYDLTPHETRLLKLLSEGHNYKTAAAKLGVSVNTVSTHMQYLRKTPRPFEIRGCRQGSPQWDRAVGGLKIITSSGDDSISGLRHSSGDMRFYAAIAILACLPGGICLAQSTGCSTPITSWTGNYTLSATASSVSCGTAPLSYTCNISQSVAVTLKSVEQVAACDLLNVLINGKITSATLDDTAAGEHTFCEFTGNKGAGQPDNNFLTISPAAGTYQLEFEPDVAVTDNPAGCGGGDSAIGAAPQTNPGWPPTYTLPATVEPLTLPNGASPFSGQAWFYDAPSNWTFDFTLTPTYNDDDDCKKSGGSDIGCQTRSLGEDQPIIGTGFNLHYESERAAGAQGNSVAAADASMIGGWTISVHHAYDATTATLFLGDGGQRNGYQLGTPVTYNHDLLLTSEDGREVYVFSPGGRHLQTLGPLTGALVYQFGYDSAGKLVTVTDESGNVTTIERNASEQATAIVSPYGQNTVLTLDSNEYLSQFTDPAGKPVTFTNTSTGLLTSLTDRNGNTYHYTYDSQGKLIKDADPAGGYTSLAQSNATSGFGETVTADTALGRKSTYENIYSIPWSQTSTSTYSKQATNTWPNGLPATETRTQQGSQLTNAITLPNETSYSDTQGPDPVWGIQAPVTTNVTRTYGNLTMTQTGGRSTTLGTAGDPFSVAAQTDTQTVNSRAYTANFTGSNLTYVSTTPTGRTLTVALDSLERVTSSQFGTLTAMQFAYDSNGRLASATQGTRVTTFSYNASGFLAGITDPLQQTVNFARDADGRVITTSLPDGRVINYAYDAEGNLISVTPPGGSPHTFTYTPVNLMQSYTPPVVAGTGPTTYTYDLDRDLTAITRPDGETISYSYNSAGQLISAGSPTGTTTYAYNPTTGNLASITNSAGKIAYSYNGPFPIKSTWTGTVSGSVGRTYNTNFWLASQTVGGGTAVAFQYDNDGLLTKAGALGIARSSQNGLITGTRLGVATDSWTYDSFGELTTYTASVNGAPVYSARYAIDADARVTAKSEKIGGASNVYSYSYDLAGRLTAASKNGAADTYTYDTNSNRLSATTAAGTSNGSYDAQDRLLTYGNISYTYTANGELASQTAGTRTTNYSYDVFGNLLSATLPNGTAIGYVIDGENRRIGKQVNGALNSCFLYTGNRIVAQLNGANQVVSQFIYATGLASPDYMVNGGATYRIFSDRLGSPVLVVNTSTGAIVEQLAYDEFGNITSDTNPGFQPFGFGGGLYDQDTKLVRFGQRDYNPATGRWTAKDPLLFEGGSTNLYSYGLNDPVNQNDPAGTDSPNLKTFTPDGGTPDGGFWQGVWQEFKEAMPWVKKAKDLKDKCDKLKKAKGLLENGTDETVDGELEQQAKSRTPVREYGDTMKEVPIKSAPSAQGLGNPVTEAFRKSATALGPCPDCNAQPNAPNPNPPQRPGLNQYQGGNP